MAQNGTAIARFYHAHCGKFTQQQCDTIKKKLLSVRRPASEAVPTQAPKAKAHASAATERLEPSPARPVSRPTSAPKAQVTQPPAKDWYDWDTNEWREWKPKYAKEDAVETDVRNFRQMSGRDKKSKLIELARTALRKKHTGLKDPSDVTKWLVVPGSRKFAGHTERFRDDLEYRKLCQDSGCVDRDGKLTMWTKDDYGNNIFQDFEEVIAQERAQGKGLPKQGRSKYDKGKGSHQVPKSTSASSSSQSWSSSSWNWQLSSWKY
jgi:hypothetical protein